MDPDTHQDAERRMIRILAIMMVVLVIVVGASVRELYYGAYPHLRPQPAVSAGSVETCDHDCVLRRVTILETRMDAVEGKR